MKFIFSISAMAFQGLSLLGLAIWLFFWVPIDLSQWIAAAFSVLSGISFYACVKIFRKRNDR